MCCFSGRKDEMARVFDAPRPLALVPYPILLARMSGKGLVVSGGPMDSKAWLGNARKSVYLGRLAAASALCCAFFLLRGRGTPKSRLARGAFLRYSIRESVVIGSAALLVGMLYHSLNPAGLLADERATRYLELRNAQYFLPKLEVDEVLALIGEGNTVFIDARRPGDYARGHIEGAVNLPPGSDEKARRKALAGIPKNAAIIVYCQSEGCGYATKAAGELVADGFGNLSLFPAGWVEFAKVRKGL